MGFGGIYRSIQDALEGRSRGWGDVGDGCDGVEGLRVILVGAEKAGATMALYGALVGGGSGKFGLACPTLFATLTNACGAGPRDKRQDRRPLPLMSPLAAMRLTGCYASPSIGGFASPDPRNPLISSLYRIGVYCKVAIFALFCQLCSKLILIKVC